ncbi:hypothetical protein VCR15J2_390059 [Vibrio coralliirubri]|uniref:hypothetical protein n=1 Tax=Vibrio coralliirubri TaxID=1516159 RepID=UPI0006300D83|nr:hypothetical protein [Vibrio coralliirubri]CDT53334.1 hypothetical protein VCR15J2_390059 [Vibrio coralliirubri]
MNLARNPEAEYNHLCVHIRFAKQSVKRSGRTILICRIMMALTLVMGSMMVMGDTFLGITQLGFSLFYLYISLKIVKSRVTMKESLAMLENRRDELCLENPELALRARKLV